MKSNMTAAVVGKNARKPNPHCFKINFLSEVKAMKKMAETGIIFMVAVALMMLIGCGKAESPQERFQEETTAKLQEMQKKIDQLKDVYNARVSTMREEFNNKMAQFKKSYDEGVTNLKQKQAAAKQGLADMKSATGEAWEKAKVKMDKMTEDMSKSLEKITSELKE